MSISWILSLLLFPLLNAALNMPAQAGFPLFLDSIFTAVSAACFGLWQGLATAILTNVMQEAFAGFPGIHLPFAICGMATALVVRLAGRNGGYGNPLRLLLCIIGVAFTNSVLGAMIATFLFGGGTGMSIDAITAGLAFLTGSTFWSAFLGRIAINLVDKTIAVVPAFALAELRRRGLEARNEAGAKR